MIVAAALIIGICILCFGVMIAGALGRIADAILGKDDDDE